MNKRSMSEQDIRTNFITGGLSGIKRGMRNERKILSLTILAIGLILGGISCRLPGGDQPIEPITVTCHVFYRASPAVPLEPGSTLTLDQHGDRQVAQFDTLEFIVQYYDDQFEGRSLVITVNAADSGQPVARQLYQMDRQQGVRNQFVGGHGFTGLVYVYHTTEAEMQYFCDVQSGRK